MDWTVEIADEFAPEFHVLQAEVQDAILAVSRLLQRFGPHPGRPRVDTGVGRRNVMALNVDDVIEGLDRTRRERVEERAAELIAEEMTLRELREARRLTQVSLARELGIGQDGISRMEQRSDLLLSTLRKTVEAMGGSLSLIARFPDRPPVELAGIAETE